MSNYFRITVYHPVHNISAIMDSNGKFEKLWLFSAYLVSKGFRIVEVCNMRKLNNGDMLKVGYDNKKYSFQIVVLGNTNAIITIECLTMSSKSLALLFLY